MTWIIFLCLAVFLFVVFILLRADLLFKDRDEDGILLEYTLAGVTVCALISILSYIDYPKSDNLTLHYNDLEREFMMEKFNDKPELLSKPLAYEVQRTLLSYGLEVDEKGQAQLMIRPNWYDEVESFDAQEKVNKAFQELLCEVK